MRYCWLNDCGNVLNIMTPYDIRLSRVNMIVILIGSPAMVSKGTTRNLFVMGF